MTAPPVVAHSSPADAVAAFYEALRKGDDSAIAGLLTEKAKAETAKSGLGIQSQASQGLRYEIRETEFVTEALDGAYVSSLWTEPGPDGQLVSTEVVWVLRKEQGGWRVSGMATPLADGQTPLLFNFEDPEDMQEKKAYAEAHLTDVHEDTPEPVGQAALPQAEMAAGGVERR
jgi:ketosteroid isomerase-like protein